MSRVHGTRRIHEVKGGHEEDPIRVQEETRGHHRTREDTPLRRFGTVRPRVQIPGPRPKSSSKSAFFGGCQESTGHSRVTDSMGTSSSTWRRGCGRVAGPAVATSSLRWSPDKLEPWRPASRWSWTAPTRRTWRRSGLRRSTTSCRTLLMASPPGRTGSRLTASRRASGIQRALWSTRTGRVRGSTSSGCLKARSSKTAFIWTSTGRRENRDARRRAPPADRCRGRAPRRPRGSQAPIQGSARRVLRQHGRSRRERVRRSVVRCRPWPRRAGVHRPLSQGSPTPRLTAADANSRSSAVERI